MRVKVKVTVRQIEAAKMDMEKTLRRIKEEYEDKNPHPSWEAEAAWRKRNLSPRDRWLKKREAMLAHFQTRMDNILLQARMERINEDTLYKMACEIGN